MIYTVTFNPALDYIMNISDYKSGSVNRSDSEMYLAGGKGINVSIVLGNLGMKSTALGFVGGFVGKEIVKRLAEYNLRSDFVELGRGNSRINVKLKADIETEINACGPDISEEELLKFSKKLENIQKGDIIVLAGSVPHCMDETIYCDILKQLAGKGVSAVVDATGELLCSTLKYQPFLIKPNVHELGEIAGRTLESEEDIIAAARSMQDMGAKNVLVSRGGDGAILVCEDGTVLMHSAPKGKMINTTGSGDSMVAGFLAGYIEYKNFKDAFLMGISAGSASAFSEYLASKNEILGLYNKIKEN